MLKLAGSAPVELVPNRDAIEILEGALALARAGEVDGAVVLLSHADGSTSDRWGHGKGFWWVKMLGASVVWQRRYIDRFAATAEEATDADR
jgi:hypothetical protein